MSSLYRDDRTPYFWACITAIEGNARRQLKKSTGTGDKKLAARIADAFEEAGQGRRTPEQAKQFLDTIEDRYSRRLVHRAFNDLLRRSTGHGLDTKTTRGFIDAWLERTREEVAPATAAWHRKAATGFLGFLGPKADQDIADLRREDISGFRDAESKRVARSTANLALKLVRAMMASAEEDGLIARNEARFVKPLRATKDAGGRRAFTIAEVKALLSVADPEWRSILLFGIYAGARLGDIAAMTWQNVDLSRGELRYVSRKTARQIILPLVGPLRAHVEAMAGDDPKASLHPRASDVLRRLGRVGSLSNQFAALLADAGLAARRSHHAEDEDERLAKGAEKQEGRSKKRQASEISFHSLRHSFVSWLKATGVAQSVVMDVAGHDSADVSRVYTHTSDDSKADALSRLPDLVG